MVNAQLQTVLIPATEQAGFNIFARVLFQFRVPETEQALQTLCALPAVQCGVRVYNMLWSIKLAEDGCEGFREPALIQPHLSCLLSVIPSVCYCSVVLQSPLINCCLAGAKILLVPVLAVTQCEWLGFKSWASSLALAYFAVRTCHKVLFLF